MSKVLDILPPPPKAIGGPKLIATSPDAKHGAAVAISIASITVVWRAAPTTAT